MKAAIFREIGHDLVVEDDVELDELGPDDVHVRVHATGVCHSDITILDGLVPMQPPIVLGHEGAGQVIAVGDRVRTVKPGQHVIMAWQPPCGICYFCVRGQGNLCDAVVNPMGELPRRFRVGSEHVPGLAGLGTFAEELLVHEQAVVPVSDTVPFHIAALVGCAVMTGVGAALNTATVSPGSTVLVVGCGGIGMSIIQGARVAGAGQIIAVDRSIERLAVAQEFGASVVAQPDEAEAAVRATTGGIGVDVAFEAVGGSKTVETVYNLTRRGGEIVLVGVAPSADEVVFNAFQLTYMERTLRGSWYGSANIKRDFARILDLWVAERLDLERLITHRVTLDDINKAVHGMRELEGIRHIVEISQ